MRARARVRIYDANCVGRRYKRYEREYKLTERCYSWRLVGKCTHEYSCLLLMPKKISGIYRRKYTHACVHIGLEFIYHEHRNLRSRGKQTRGKISDNSRLAIPRASGILIGTSRYSFCRIRSHDLFK